MKLWIIAAIVAVVLIAGAFALSGSVNTEANGSDTTASPAKACGCGSTCGHESGKCGCGASCSCNGAEGCGCKK